MFDCVHLIQTPTDLDQTLKTNSHYPYCMVLIAEQCFIDQACIYDALMESEIVFFGGIFPEVIYANKSYKKGLLLAFIDYDIDITKIDDISKAFEIDRKESNFSLIFVDALAKAKGEFIDEVYDKMGEISYMGGGCGKLTLKQEAVILDQSGFSQNSAIIVHTKVDNRVSMSHGFENTGITFFANEAEGSVVKSLDFEPAFDTYKRTLKQNFGVEVSSENLFEVAHQYPLGLTMMDGSVIVRDPLFINEEQEMVCAGDVPINSIVSLLHGKKEKLLEASKLLAQENLKFFRKICKKEPHSTFLVDCISRVLFLEDAFDQELEAITACFSDLSVPFGVLSIGEVANDGNRFLQFNNKTSVIGSF